LFVQFRFRFAMSHLVAPLRAYQCDLARAVKGLDESTQQNRVAHLNALRQILFDPARGAVRREMQLRNSMQKYENYFTAEFDVTILQVNGEQHKVNVCGNTTILKLRLELAERLKRQPEELQLAVNEEMCRSQQCLWQYGVVKGFGDQAFWLTFRRIDTCTTNVNTAKHEFSGAWRIEVGCKFENLQQRFASKILEKACSSSVISREEKDGLLRQGEMSVAHLCGMLGCINPCEHHTCAFCREQGKQLGDCSFTEWMASKQQAYEAEAAKLLDGSKSRLQKRRSEMEYSEMLSKHSRAWKGAHGRAFPSALSLEAN